MCCIVSPQVYTLVDESRHLLVFGAPKINLQNELHRLFEKIGAIESIHLMTAEMSANKTGKVHAFSNIQHPFVSFIPIVILVEVEQFTDCYHIVYEKLYCARRAKQANDRRNFYGGKSNFFFDLKY